ncbi:protein ANTAGONIST OF LIKE HETEROCHROMATIN PROTEIN 1-like [Aphis craccivora]|uniref:Protein ANTAGONIST OF LIKE HETEROCHROMATIN PROTEIN 1-like n=1 Tax=Aphis craccivora TaxID=307492 RepID=A0A6G0Y154_APHCR|nr:protein ANTAGONIST OF LIKE HETEROCHROMATIN PROTEIN 1-like [Aphis craccivora]
MDHKFLSQDDDEELFLNNERHRRITVYNKSDLDFKIHFSLTRRSIETLILHMGPLLSQSDLKLDIKNQLLIFIWYMANYK